MTDADTPDERPAADGAPSGFANYAAYEPPNVVAPPPAPRPDGPTSSRGGSSRLPLVIGIVVVIALGVGAFLVLGGGSDDDAPSASGPGDAVTAWASRMADQDYAAACKLLATPSVEQITADGKTCAAALERLDPDGLYSRAGGVEVVKEDIDGTTAQVTVSGGGAALDGKVIVVVKQAGTWKASPFADGTDDSQTEPTPAPKPSDNIDGASAAACSASIATTQTAEEAFEALNGTPAADVQALVDAGFLREVPPNVAIGPDGTVTGTGPCA